jgi:hypothetical protein
MSTNLDKYRADLRDLTALGDQMFLDLYLQFREEEGQLDKEQIAQAKKVSGTFLKEYQRWYTEASAVIRQLIPDRLAEFEHLYKGDGKRKSIDITTFTIQDWTNGVRASDTGSGAKRFDDCAAVSMRFQNQLAILKASERRFESSLLDIRQLVYADLMDSEIEAGRELLKHGFRRAAGAVAGVVLEKHLGQIAQNHKITLKKKDPTISELNDQLKAEKVFEIPIWRQIQRLGDPELV